MRVRSPSACPLSPTLSELRQHPWDSAPIWRRVSRRPERILAAHSRSESAVWRAFASHVRRRRAHDGPAVVKWRRGPRETASPVEGHCYLVSLRKSTGSAFNKAPACMLVRGYLTTKIHYGCAAPADQGLSPINFRRFRLLKSSHRHRRLGMQATFQLVALGALAFLGACAGAPVFFI